MAQVGENEGDTTSTAPPPSAGELKEAIDGMSDRATLLENDVDALKKLKVTGYVQAEWQHYDQKTNVGGAALYSNSVKNLFLIRRGRIKFKYSSGMMDVVVQPDFTERGFEIKDAYLELRLLENDLLTMNMGIFNRPDYEVEYSSSSREATERSQVVLAFYPKERDLGVMFTLKKELFDGFTPKLNIALFNGEGVTNAEKDPYKDLMTRLTFGLPLGSESPVQIDLGAGLYYGGIPQLKDTIYTATTTGKSDSASRATDAKFIKVDPIAGSNMKGMGNRMNIGIEAQIYLDILPFGGTIIKGELLSGKRPELDALSNLIVRQQSGWYGYFVQNFGTEFQIAARLDNFDRNTTLAGTDVKNVKDANSTVLGLGGSYFNDKLKVTLWYEMPAFATNENLQTDRTADVKDNKTTVRFQYKF